jgi:hypothetical protein
MPTSPLTVLDKTVKTVNDVINDNVVPFVEKTVAPMIKSRIKTGNMPGMPNVPNVKPLIADSMFVQYAKPVAKRSWKISGQAVDFVAARSPKYLGEQMEAAFGSAKTWFDANVIEIERTAKPVAAKPVTVKPVTVKPVTVKTVTKKTVTKKTAAKPVVAKTVVAKTVVTKTVAAKPVTKKAVTKKAATTKSVATKTARKAVTALEFDPYNA